MPDTPSITLVKRFTYRGAPEEWSNTYHFTGDTPGDGVAWKALVDALWAEEKKCLSPANQLVKAYGYAAGNEHSVYQWDGVALGATLTAGSLTVATTDRLMSGDQAATLRAYVRQSSTGKKVYVRKFFHGGACVNAEPDQISPNMKAALNALGAKLTDGSLPGGFKWSAPQGQLGVQPAAQTFVTTRTLKRRGKRP